MGISLEGLNPSQQILTIHSRALRLLPINLRCETSFIEKYRSLNLALDKIKEDKFFSIDFLWEIIQDKEAFNYDLDEFKLFLYSGKESIGIWVPRVFEAISKAVDNSSPVVKNPKRLEEIKKIKEAANPGEDNSVCYGVYFDKFAARYGYTLEQFYDLTLKQVHALLKVINDQEYKELEVNAALAGRELKPQVIYNDFTEEEEAENEQQALDALAELQRKFKERNEGKQ